jgi:hypothetical protein
MSQISHTIGNIHNDNKEPSSYDQITPDNWGIEYKIHHEDVFERNVRHRHIPPHNYDWMNPLNARYMDSTVTSPIMNSTTTETMYITLLHHNGTISPFGPAMDTPSKVRIPLKPHQRRTLYEMHTRENLNHRLLQYNMLFLCDNVGSGKSLCMLALIAESPQVKMWSNIVKVQKLTDRKDKKLAQGVVLADDCIEFQSNLIVVPHGVYFQWLNYIGRYTNLTHLAVGGAKDISGIGNTRDAIIQTLNSVDIVLVKSTMFQDFMEHLAKTGNLRHRTNRKTRVYAHQYSHDNNAIMEYDEHGNAYKREYTDGTTMLVEDNRFTNYAQIESYIRHSFNTFTKDFNEGRFESYEQFIDTIGKLRDRIDYARVQTTRDYVECEHVEEIEGFVFQRVIFDEADSIKLPSCTHVFGKMTWCITSSMASLLFPHGEYNSTVLNLTDGMRGCTMLKSKMNYLRSSYNVGYHTARIYGCMIRNHPEFVMDSMSLPSPTISYHRCYTPSHIAALNGNIDEAIMRAMNAGDLDQTAVEIGCPIRSETNIIKSACNMFQTQFDSIQLRISEKQRQIQEIGIEREKFDAETREKGVLEENEKNERARHSHNLYSRLTYAKKSLDDLKVEMKLVDERIHNIKERICQSSEKTCPVCLDTCTKPTILNCCNNIFCFNCIHHIVNGRAKCPMCRAGVNPDSMNLILDISKYERQVSNAYDDITDMESQLTAMTESHESSVLFDKIDVLIRELIMNPTKRYLVFSEFNGTFNVIRDRLDQTCISYEMLSGSTVHIQKIIQSFREGKVQVLLLNARFFGAGLNLQMTDEIIIYHRMNSDLEKQVIGRAQRLGRETTLSIRYLCYNNEIPVEETIPNAVVEPQDTHVDEINV